MSTLATLTLATLLLNPQPEKSTIAIVPPVNLTGENWPELRLRINEKIAEYTRSEFTRRGFQIVPTENLLQAADNLKIDFLDEEFHNRATLYRLANTLQADYILFTVVTHTDQKKQNRTFYEDIEGRTDVKIWLLDAKRQEAVVSARTFTGRSGGARLGDGRGSQRQIQAGANAVRDALKPFFKNFAPLPDKT